MKYTGGSDLKVTLTRARVQLVIDAGASTAAVERYIAVIVDM